MAGSSAFGGTDGGDYTVFTRTDRAADWHGPSHVDAVFRQACLMRIEPHPRDHWLGILIALVAGLHKAILTSTPVNDDYQHLAYARQLLAGDLPLRNFWDLSTTLQEVISAVSQLVFGHRLLSEAIVIGVATAVAVYLVFRVVQQVTGSSLIAALCAALFIVALPRAYAYPKWIVYALASWLWWSNVWWPSRQKAIAAGLSVAAAFYWRHDHGVLVAVGVALGMAAAHGFSRTAIRHTALAGVVALGVTLPYLVFAATQLGLGNLARMELTALDDENDRSRTELRWPMRATADLFRREPPDVYAPQLTIRWKESASARGPHSGPREVRADANRGRRSAGATGHPVATIDRLPEIAD